MEDKVRKKCGEIFVHEDDLFSFICTLCEAPFQEVDNFFLHIKGDHEQKYKLNKQQKDYEREELHDGNFEEQDKKSIHIPEIEIKINPKDTSYAIELNNSSDISEDDLKGEQSENDESDNECTNVWDQIMKENSNEESNEIKRNKKDEMSERTENNLECLVCGKCFSNVDRFRIHNEKGKCADKSKKPSLKCDRCGKEFRTQRNYKRHIVWSKRCQNPKGISDPIIEKRSLKCKYCDERFPPFNHMLETHERTHTGERPFQCQICGKQFRTKLVCTNHEKLHTGEKLFKCHLCNLEFKSLSNLYSHKQRHGEKKFSCGFCERTFFRRSEKTAHERIHTGDKPYKCRFCGKCFKTSSSMTKHQKTHLLVSVKKNTKNC